MLKESYHLLKKLRLPHGMYLAAPNPDYRYVWIRDSIYMSLPFIDKKTKWFEKTIYRLFDLFIEYEEKLTYHTIHKPAAQYQYIHARYSKDDVKEIHDQEWGHAQHDMIGAFLFAVGKGEKSGRKVFRNEKDREILQKLVDYLKVCEYWQDEDNGMWEEWKEVHMSSVGACVAGLESVKHLVCVPPEMIEKGISAITTLFPRESKDRSVDLAQLSLIYPYNLFQGVLGNEIINNVEKNLLRTRGVARYPGDSYYSTLAQEHGRDKGLDFYKGSEMEWTFGLPWLALARMTLGGKENFEKAKDYIEQTEKIMIEPGELPEGYYSNTDKPCPNSPLGWSSAMYILAKEKYEQEIKAISN